MSTNFNTRLRWVRRDEAAHAAAAAPLDASIEAVEELDDIRLLVQMVGEPKPDTELSVRDEAVFFLQIAAEVEHALLVQYLYALYSLNAAAGVPVISWVGVLRRIAREEMGHLVTLQNLLAALGAPPHLRRERTPAPEQLFPFPVSFEPFGLDVVKRYVVAESPQGATLPDDLADLKTTINHVGFIYMKLYWLFERTDAPEGPWRLPPDLGFESRHLDDTDFVDPLSLVDRLATAEEWAKGDMSILVLPDRPPTSLGDLRDKSLEAIFLVAAQGEGLVSQTNSHFDRFLKIYTEMKSFAGQVTLPIATNPATAPRPGATLITDPQTLAWARLANLRYEILLMEIEHALSLPRSQTSTGEDPRTNLALWAVGDNPNEMVGGMRTVARRLLGLPITTGATTMAGLPFEPPVDFLPAGERARWERHLALIQRSRELIDAINDSSLDEIRDVLDGARIPFIEQQIAANF
ncbi:MAG: hypothetical protein QOD32_1379 [Pyrinomonadaceae bacterium]|jgi:hypothetical protein|nr:hypothetical protein [Pyrinomonadaceae bacterium]